MIHFILALLILPHHGSASERPLLMRAFLNLPTQDPFEQTLSGNIPSAAQREILEGKLKAYERLLKDSEELSKDAIKQELARFKQEANTNCHVSIDFKKADRYSILIVLGTLGAPASSDFDVKFKDRGEEEGKVYEVKPTSSHLQIRASREWGSSELNIEKIGEGLIFKVENKGEIGLGPFKKTKAFVAVCQITNAAK